MELRKSVITDMRRPFLWIVLYHNVCIRWLWISCQSDFRVAVVSFVGSHWVQVNICTKHSLDHIYKYWPYEWSILTMSFSVIALTATLSCYLQKVGTLCKVQIKPDFNCLKPIFDSTVQVQRQYLEKKCCSMWIWCQCNIFEKFGLGHFSTMLHQPFKKMQCTVNYRG